MASRSQALSGSTTKTRADAKATTKRRSQPAALLMVSTGALVLLGLIMILSASSVSSFATYGSSFLFFNKQLLWAGIGLAGFVFFSRFDYRKLKGRAYLLLPAVGILLLAVL